MTPCRALVRVRVPDRPGALGLVASRIGAVKCDIVGIEIVDRQDGTALDELAVVLPDASVVPTVEREIAEVDGAVVAGIEIVDAFPEPRLDEIQFALGLGRARDAHALFTSLVDRIGTVVRPEWCRAHGGGVDVGDGTTSPVTRTDAVTESIELTVSGVTVTFGRLTPLHRGERRIVTAYCELTDAMFLRLPRRTAADG
jgi:hypothetical protein